MTADIRAEASGRRLLTGGTLRAGAAALAVLCGLLLLLAWIWPERRPVSDLDRYLRRGNTAGAEALRADILRHTAPGADAGPAVQRLMALGFACTAPGGAAGEWVCVHRRPEEGRRLRVVEARIRVAEGRTAEVETRATDRTLP